MARLLDLGTFSAPALRKKTLCTYLACWGCSLKHDTKSLNAIGRHAYADHINKDDPGVAIFHHVSTPGLDIPASSLRVVPTAAELAANPQVRMSRAVWLCDLALRSGFADEIGKRGWKAGVESDV